jgi:hypothetical protein
MAKTSEAKPDKELETKKNGEFKHGKYIQHGNAKRPGWSPTRSPRSSTARRTKSKAKSKKDPEI